MAVDPGATEEIAAWLGGRAERVIETHAARVFLIGPDAYKLKKPVDLGYLDFSTPARREAVIRRELELNRPGAPGLYLDVQHVTREPDGALSLDGAGERLEAVLHMRRFDPEAVLSHRPEAVTGDFAEHLGRTIARYHAAAERTPDGGGAAAMRFVIDSNADHLRRLDALKGEAAEALIAASDAALRQLGPLLDARRDAGFARRCHGDLHLGNIVVIDGRPVLFDCIEFNDALSRIDVLYDVAFLVMDLCFRERFEGAVRVLNGYLDEAAREDGGPFEGLAALPFFLSVRATVRAHVSAQMHRPEQARAYLEAARAHLRPRSPALAAVGGLSGTGKSTVARALAPLLGAQPGAVVLRTDEIRKRLWGAAPTDRLPQAAYAAGQSERVYDRMLAEAETLLRAGRAVVLDGVFLKPGEREAARALAQRCGVPFRGGWLTAPPELLRQRIGGRRGDASDADAAVLDLQLALDPGPIDWLQVDASQTADASAERIARGP